MAYDLKNEPGKGAPSTQEKSKLTEGTEIAAPQPKDTIAKINGAITGLELWLKTDDITKQEEDSATLAIGKLRGAIIKLNRE